MVNLASSSCSFLRIYTLNGQYCLSALPPPTPMPPPTPLLDQIYLGVNLWWFYFVSRTFKSRNTCVFRRAEWKWLKEPKWKSSQILQFRARFCRNCNFFFPAWKNVPGAYSERFSDIIGHREHPENTLKRRFLSKKRAERGWKSGARSLSWKSGWKPSTIREFWHQRISGSFFRLEVTAVWTKSAGIKKNPLVNAWFCWKPIWGTTSGNGCNGA